MRALKESLECDLCSCPTGTSSTTSSKSALLFTMLQKYKCRNRFLAGLNVFQQLSSVSYVVQTRKNRLKIIKRFIRTLQPCHMSE